MFDVFGHEKIGIEKCEQVRSVKLKKGQSVKWEREVAMDRQKAKGIDWRI